MTFLDTFSSQHIEAALASRVYETCSQLCMFKKMFDFIAPVSENDFPIVICNESGALTT